jgi:hypothetical protein
VLVLLASTWKPISNTTKEWNHEDFKRIKACKPNILTSVNHHMSSGFYASFGNKVSFDKIPNVESSVGQCITKKNKLLLKQLHINKEAMVYEKYAADDISRSVKDLKTFIPNI